ncbi:cadmium-exporting ATPase [Clostridium sp. CAG:448]|nr:cadmium-exporting ATPase [Clostridium sp. CAG:448]
MRKVFKMEDLDCANCAAKMEEAIKKIDGVTYASVSFIAQRLTLEADDSRFDAIAKEAAKICSRVDADCRVILK